MHEDQKPTNTSPEREVAASSDEPVVGLTIDEQQPDQQSRIKSLIIIVSATSLLAGLFCLLKWAVGNFHFEMTEYAYAEVRNARVWLVPCATLLSFGPISFGVAQLIVKFQKTRNKAVRLFPIIMAWIVCFITITALWATYFHIASERHEHQIAENRAAYEAKYKNKKVDYCSSIPDGTYYQKILDGSFISAGSDNGRYVEVKIDGQEKPTKFMICSHLEVTKDGVVSDISSLGSGTRVKVSIEEDEQGEYPHIDFVRAKSRP